MDSYIGRHKVKLWAALEDYLKIAGVKIMVEFFAGLLVGATLATVALGAHFVKLTGELREQIAKLQIDLRHK